MIGWLARHWRAGAPNLITVVSGPFSDAPFPPQGSLRGASGRGSQSGPLGKNQIAWIDERMPKVRVIAGQALAARVHSESSRQDRQGEMVSHE